MGKADSRRLLWRAWSVIQTPNEVLVDKLGLDIPPAPVVTLEEISPREIQIGWKLSEQSSSIQEYQVEVNGRHAGNTKKTETAAVIYNLFPATVYDIRVFSVSAGRFQTPSFPLHVRLPSGSRSNSQDSTNEAVPAVRALAARPPTAVPAPSAPAMTREPSGGYISNRRGTTGRKSSPAGGLAYSTTGQGDGTSREADEEDDGNLGELSQKFQKIQLDIEGIDAQIQEEDKEFEAQLKEIEVKRDNFRQDLRKRDEESSDLRKQVHKAETQNRALINDRTKKERELQQKESDRRRKRDDVGKWEEQISSMSEEMDGIETQKAAIKRRAQSEIREVRRKIEEEQKEVAAIEEEIREKSSSIKTLEEERKQLGDEDETEESREADRIQREKELKWKQKAADLHNTYTRLWNEFTQAKHYFDMAAMRHQSLQRNLAHSVAPPAPLDLEITRRGMKSMRHPRHTSSHGSSISSPRGLYTGDPMHPNGPYPPQNNSPTTSFGQNLFNMQNGMTLMMPNEIPMSTAEEVEPISSVPMSPHAEVLLPSDLLGDESADEMGDDDLPMPTKPTVADTGLTPFPRIGSPTLHEDAPMESPSAGSSSGRSFSSPREAFVNATDFDRKSIHSTHQGFDKDKLQEPTPSNSRKLMQSLFSFNRQRGKTLADQPPLLGSLKPTQSQSFPRNYDDLDPNAQPRRRLSYGGNWAFGSGLLQRGDKQPETGRLAAARRGFPSLIPGFGRSTEATGSYDPFASRANSFDPALRGDSNSPRPSSTYSFDKIGRPSFDSQFRPWNLEKGAMRNSPLAPDWGSFHSFSRNPSRRPSVGYGSTSQLSLSREDDEIVESKRDSRPLQAPIGTRPTSSQTSQMPGTPKLNPAAPSFTMFFKGRPKEKTKTKEENEAETTSPSESRKSKDTASIAPTASTFESRESLDRTTSYTSTGTPVADSSVNKPTLMSRISRKASANKFGSWKDKGGIFSSRKDSATTPTGEESEDQTGSLEHLGRSLESTSTTPSAEDRDKKASRTSLNWSFMRKTRPQKGSGVKEEVSASEVSEADISERTSDIDEAEDVVGEL